MTAITAAIFAGAIAGYLLGYTVAAERFLRAIRQINQMYREIQDHGGNADAAVLARNNKQDRSPARSFMRESHS